jgi:hypothetical protein
MNVFELSNMIDGEEVDFHASSFAASLISGGEPKRQASCYHI